VPGDEPNFVSVILGGFGTEGGAPRPAIEGEQIAIDADGVAEMLSDAEDVIIVPGYGMAVAQAQHSVRAHQASCAPRADVRFAIHPVAGRCRGT
jgi:H+-translocating NAD(P) transhydrogenase subunit beta